MEDNMINNSGNITGDNNQDKTNDYEEYCSVCHRSSRTAGRMLHLPNGITVCEDCMQKMMNMTSKIDYSKIFADQNMINELNKMMHDSSHSNTTVEKQDKPEKKDEPEIQDNSKDVDVIIQIDNDSSSDNDADNQDDDKNKDKEKDKKKGPAISFMTLGDIFNGMGGNGGPQVKKKKKDRPKPVFTIDNMPAPHVIKSTLDEYVIGQEKAKKALSVAVYNHYKRVTTGHMDDIEIEKSNILMIGPTGCGKTYLVKTLARLLDVPLAISDATSLTEAGYIGDDIESVVSKLLDDADNDVARAEKGIVFIDEIDKIAKKSNTTSRDVNGESVQQGMLKLLEGAEVEVPVGSSSKNAMVPMATVDTRNILFICGGAFPNLDNLIKDRLTKQSGFGYNAELKDKYDNDKDILSRVQTEDLRAFGFIPEFIGRLPVVCTLQNLDRDALVKILTEPKNAILKQYEKLLELDEVKLEFEPEALNAIADKALKKETGARALRAIIEEFMLDIMYEVPKDDSIGRVVITKDYIEGKGAPIIEMRTDTADIAHEQKIAMRKQEALPFSHSNAEGV